jgi:YesN/AraC family two-component response regulator
LSLTQELKYFAKSFSILVVEDETVVNEQLCELLSIFFKDVYSAYDGVEGLQNYKKFSPDIVLTDITMPKLNGINMSQDIKNLNRDQPIVVLSAHSEASYMIDLIDIGVAQFILKPIDKNTLFYRLLKVCENLHYKNAFEKFYSEYKAKELARKEMLMQKSSTNRAIPTKKDIKESPNITNEVSSGYNLSHKVEDASSFMNELQDDELLWMSFKDDIDELMAISGDLTNYIDKFNLKQNLDDELRVGIVESFINYAKIFSSLDEMKKMSTSLEMLAQFLDELDLESLTQEQQRKLRLLEFINDDITKFLNMVFVYKDRVDIYYLEDSLDSSITQLKGEISGDFVDDEEFELF